jgi:hypothetical protein
VSRNLRPPGRARWRALSITRASPSTTTFVMPLAGIVWTPVRGLDLFTDVGQGFRSPNQTELSPSGALGPLGASGGTPYPDLAVPKVESYDFGATASMTDRRSVTAAGYHTFNEVEILQGGARRVCWRRLTSGSRCGTASRQFTAAADASGGAIATTEAPTAWRNRGRSCSRLRGRPTGSSDGRRCSEARPGRRPSCSGRCSTRRTWCCSRCTYSLDVRISWCLLCAVTEGSQHPAYHLEERPVHLIRLLLRLIRRFRLFVGCD